MKFDLFHSVGRIDSVPKPISDRQVFEQFFDQVQLGESIGLQTIWVAESHFSSEVQKSHPAPVIPNYRGEVGLNADSFQLAQALFQRTERIGFGTAILNIVGGNGGPIAAADRVRSLTYLNSLSSDPRELNIGVAAGRFPYINAPFGIVPRNETEEVLWPQYKQLIFVEALEIFLRLVHGETLGSEDVCRHMITEKFFRDPDDLAVTNEKLKALGAGAVEADGIPYVPRWDFLPLKLVPAQTADDWEGKVRFVLGSSDPYARDHGSKFADLDIFNLSFTPPDKLNLIHREMTQRYQEIGRQWRRDRLPRTVLVFIHKDPGKAKQLAEDCFDTYIEAMRGTVRLPPKEVLMERALIGDPAAIREQLAPGHPKGFDDNDRLMLWFEFNQTDGDAIHQQMRLFGDQVIAKLP